MLLVQRGALSLDDDVRRYLPELPDCGTTITLLNLLEHTSGRRDHDHPYRLRQFIISPGFCGARRSQRRSG